MKLRMLVLLTSAVALISAEARADGPFFFYSLTPCRLVDTRNPAGTNGGPALESAQTRSFQVRTLCGVPSGARAVALNVVAVGPTADAHLRLWPSGTAMPLVSALNFAAGELAIANGAIVPLSTQTLDLSVYNASGTTHLVVDVTGYFAAIE